MPVSPPVFWYKIKKRVHRSLMKLDKAMQSNNNLRSTLDQLESNNRKRVTTAGLAKQSDGPAFDIKSSRLA